WGYFLPRSDWFLGVKDEQKRQRYLSAWLDLRVPWMYVLSCRNAAVPRTLSSQLWRDYLQNARDVLSSDSSMTRAGERRSHLAAILTKVLPPSALSARTSGVIQWMEHSFDGPMPSRLWPQVLWELHEVAFQYELLELDRVMVPNAAHSGLDAESEEVTREALICAIFPGACSLQVSDLAAAQQGLASELRDERGRALDRWLRVVRRWPRCPDSLRNCTRLEYQFTEGQMNYVERVLVQYYVETFFEWAVRLPILPRRCP
ncbi:uncharacterized protein B0H18DRAFT_822342, partial [Fomitopsis serialis]|uniref:uncharacterized protein n=1 Tax=Fomitopsis serialis TaxID=139415 RepID=UPI00200804C8